MLTVTTMGASEYAPPHVFRVLIVDDQPESRVLLREALGRSDAFTVVGEAANGEEAMRLAEALAPELVVMDIQMPGVSGLEMTGRIRRRFPGIRVFLVSSYNEMEYRRQATESGAVGFLPKSELSAPRVLQELGCEAP